MRNAKRMIGWGVAALLVVVFLFLVTAWTGAPEPFDDAFIAFRFAENAVDGNGLVFNRGERVEGFSSPLFMALLVLAGKIGVGFAAAAVAINGLAMASVLLLCVVWVKELAPDHYARTGAVNRFAGLIATGVAWAWLVLHPSSQLYLTSGMETWLFSALLFGFVFCCGRPGSPVVSAEGQGTPVRKEPDSVSKKAFTLGVLATFLALARPEGMAALPVAAGVILMDARTLPGGSRLKAWSSCLVVPVLVLGSLLALRLWYYGLPLPNTYYAKIGSSDLGRWTRGIEYVLREAPWLVAPVVLFALVRKAENRQSIALFGLWTFGVAFSVYSGGDWMPGSRFLVPSQVALAPMVGILGVWAWEHLARKVWWQRLVTLGLVALLCGHVLLAQLNTVRVQRREADWIRTFSGVARKIAEERPASLVATGGIGIVAYAGDLDVLDVFGLTEPAIAEAGKWASGGTAGHQSYDGVFVWSREPDVLLPHSVVTGAPLTSERFLETVLAAPEPNRFWMAEFTSQDRFAERYSYRVFEPRPGRFVGAYQMDAASKLLREDSR